MMKKIILIGFIVLMAIFIGCTQNQVISDFDDCVNAGYPIMESYPRQCSDGENTFVEELDMQKQCVKENGRWLGEFNECEGILVNSCESLGGEFFECGSACRHEPESQVCTMQCVSYCSFN